MVTCGGNLFSFIILFVFLELICQIPDVFSVNAEARQKTGVQKIRL